jgi:hypothetical protein
MVNRAITDFAEAVSGDNRNMQWSLSPEIMMRSVKPVFDRLYEGKLTAEQAITVAMDYVAPRVKNNIDTCQDLFNTLDARLEATLNETILPAQAALNELFLGLNEEFNWTTDPHYMADELRPTFDRVASGVLVPGQAVMLFVDNMRTRTEAMLGIIKGLVIELAQQFYATMKTQQDVPKAVNGND